MIKLHDIPNHSPIRVAFMSNGQTDVRDATFHHPDGAYSFCNVDGEDEDDPGRIFHLYRFAEVEFVDGRWQLSGQRETIDAAR